MSDQFKKVIDPRMLAQTISPYMINNYSTGFAIELLFPAADTLQCEQCKNYVSESTLFLQEFKVCIDRKLRGHTPRSMW